MLHATNKLECLFLPVLIILAGKALWGLSHSGKLWFNSKMLYKAGKAFQPSLMFASKAWGNPNWNGPCLQIFKQAGTNALAYLSGRINVVRNNKFDNIATWCAISIRRLRVR